MALTLTGEPGDSPEMSSLSWPENMSSPDSARATTARSSLSSECSSSCWDRKVTSAVASPAAHKTKPSYVRFPVNNVCRFGGCLSPQPLRQAGACEGRTFLKSNEPLPQV